MTQQEMKARTKRFALRVIKLVDSLPDARSSGVIGKQLLRSGTSVGANYRSACRAKSTADFVFKLSIVEEEADESVYWMELLVESSLVKAASLAALIDEANQLVAIVVSSSKTLKRKRNPKSEFPNPKSK
jgi:four helix bundle protein